MRGNTERYVGPTTIERASRSGLSGFRDAGDNDRSAGGVGGGWGCGRRQSGRAGPYARSVLQGVQTDKTAITAKQET